LNNILRPPGCLTSYQAATFPPIPATAYETDSRSGGGELFPTKDTAANWATLNVRAANTLPSSIRHSPFAIPKQKAALDQATIPCHNTDT